MFFSPLDRDTVNAMVRYQDEQIHESFRRSSPAEAPIVVVPSHSAGGFIAGLRQSVGLALIRAGARLAGVGLQQRAGAQS